MPPRKVYRKSSKKSSRKGSKRILKIPSASCGLCKRNFPSKDLLNKHNAKHHFLRHCPNCPKTFRKTRSFVYHLRSHIEDHPYECKNCLSAFNQKRDLLAHELREKNTRQFSCDICHGVFFHLAALHRHRLAHDGPPYSCQDCGARFSNIPDKIVHSKNHVYRCILCPKEVVTFSTNVGLAYHMGKVHQRKLNDPVGSDEADSLEPCISTGAVNLGEDGDTDSMEDILSESDSDSDVDSNYQKESVEFVYNLKRKDKFFCFICYDLYPSCELLKSHMKAHRWHPCNSCPKFFAHAYMLKKHECDLIGISLAGIPDYSDAALCKRLVVAVRNMKSHQGLLDHKSFELIGYHYINLKIILEHPLVKRLFPETCRPALQELYSALQDLNKCMVVEINRPSAQ